MMFVNAGPQRDELIMIRIENVPQQPEAHARCHAVPRLCFYQLTASPILAEISSQKSAA
jgi:hypothetical protein